MKGRARVPLPRQRPKVKPNGKKCVLRSRVLPIFEPEVEEALEVLEEVRAEAFPAEAKIVECDQCGRPMRPGRAASICDRCLTASGE